jgi:hypothetical protein
MTASQTQGYKLLLLCSQFSRVGTGIPELCVGTGIPKLCGSEGHFAFMVELDVWPLLVCSDTVPCASAVPSLWGDAAWQPGSGPHSNSVPCSAPPQSPGSSLQTDWEHHRIGLQSGVWNPVSPEPEVFVILSTVITEVQLLMSSKFPTETLKTPFLKNVRHRRLSLLGF